MSAKVYVIAGPNGAGKTTFAREFLPNYANCPNFVNADLIAARLSPRAPESAAIAAGRQMLKEIEALSERREDFGFETTLSGRGYASLVPRLKRQDYEVHFFYLWLPSVELAISRVKERVLRGGHDIPEAVIRRRFQRSFANFWKYYRPIADGWTLFNSEQKPVVVASAARRAIQVAEQSMYNRIIESL
ncbi:MAG TPA: AAA family ATPase [Candidatus Acidoferrum sp.]